MIKNLNINNYIKIVKKILIKKTKKIKIVK